MAQWTPTKANYLGRVSKEKIIEAVTEGISAPAAENLATLTKDVMAQASETKISGARWLPALLRTPTRPEAAAKAKGEVVGKPRVKTSLEVMTR
jgi:ParB family chromosome partitioning protein